MPDYLLDWLVGFQKPGAMARVATGFFLAFLFRWVYCKVKHSEFQIPWPHIGITIGIIVLLWSTIQAQQAYELANQTAEDNKQCQKEFHQAIIKGRAITNENDELSQKQRKLFLDKDHEEAIMWTTLLAPTDPYIESLPDDHPERQAYNLDVVTKYSNRANELDKEIIAIQEHQDYILATRPPLPDPTCGK